MKRALVLSNEAARHSFRQKLPRHVFAKGLTSAPLAPAARADDNDWKLFVLSFAAFFTVAYTFIL